MSRARAGLVLAAAPLAMAAALAVGSAELAPSRILAALAGGGDDVAREIVWGLRAPRAAAAFAGGALLALAGTLLQVLLRNPLADPGILGVSGGAAAGALAAILLGLPVAGVHASAFAGACVAAGALVALCARFSGWNVHRVLLTGIALAALGGALVSLMLALAPAMQLQGMLFWLLGDLSAAPGAGPAWLVLAVAGSIALALAGSLDALPLGLDKARSLGVAVGGVQTAAFFCATAATVAAVMLAGAIGFVGLVVPHALRLAGFHSHRQLLPLAVVAGGSLLTLADTLARTLASPLELPVGAIMAAIGAPVLLALLARTR